jgi:hypothetical protein
LRWQISQRDCGRNADCHEKPRSINSSVFISTNLLNLLKNQPSFPQPSFFDCLQGF